MFKWESCSRYKSADIIAPKLSRCDTKRAQCSIIIWTETHMTSVICSDSRQEEPLMRLIFLLFLFWAISHLNLCVGADIIKDAIVEILDPILVVVILIILLILVLNGWRLGRADGLRRLVAIDSPLHHDFWGWSAKLFDNYGILLCNVR